MPRKKQLLIGNADKFYNLSLVSNQSLNNYLEVTDKNVDKINEGMLKLIIESSKSDPLGLHTRNDINYLVYSFSNISKEALTNLVHYGNSVLYVADSTIQDDIIDVLAIAKNRKIKFTENSLLDYKYMKDNVREAHTACTTMVDIKINPFDNPDAILFKLYPYRYNLDYVNLTFKKFDDLDNAKSGKFYKINNQWELKARYKFDIYKKLKTSLSIWKMNIRLITGDDIYQLRDMVLKDQKKVKNPKKIGG